MIFLRRFFHFAQLTLQRYSQYIYLKYNSMNIKISLKGFDNVTTNSPQVQFSEVQQKKKAMLYAPPEKDSKKNTHSKKQIKNTQKHKSMEKKSNAEKQSEKYRGQSQKQMLNELKKAGQNKATLDMVQNSNTILQRQNEILHQNQRTIDRMVKNQSSRSPVEEKEKKNLNEALDQVESEMREMKKIRDQMMSIAKDFNQNFHQLKSTKNIGGNNVPERMSNMNSNFKDLIAVSQNHVEGLEKMEAIKQLQNFNIEGYTQAINSIKRQIAQYQKQSENIERQLKIRAAKLEKLEVPPNFDKELLEPYENHLKQKVNSIDLESVKERVYEKIGQYDYGRFEYSVGELMLDVKNEINDFYLVCQEHKITVPEIRFDPKELKQMDLKIPSVLDEYKKEKGIIFEEEKKQKKQNNKHFANKQQKGPHEGSRRTQALQETLTQTNPKPQKVPQNMKRIKSKPIDKSSDVQLNRTNERQTILMNQDEKDKKEVEKRMKKTSREKRKQDEEFEKYLENRARQQLEQIYRERKENLERMQRELNQACEQPQYINLNLSKEQVKRQKQQEHQYKIPPKRNQVREEHEQPQQEREIKEKKEERKELDPIKEMGKDVLKQKLKNLLNTRNKEGRQQSRQRPRVEENYQMQNMAEGVVNLINNTLTQVNSNLANTIERRMRASEEKRPVSRERREPRRIQIPKLQEFHAPPPYTINVGMPPQYPHHQKYQFSPPKGHQKKQQKIVPKNYDHLKVQMSEMKEKDEQLRVSESSSKYDDDFE